MGQEDLVKEFVAVTGSDEATARQMLDAYENNLQFAVSAYLDDGFQKNDSGCVGDSKASDDVRAPIPQTRGVLVDDYEPSPHWISRYRPRSVFDGFRNFKAEEDGNDAADDKKLKRLEDLFRPPLDMMHKGTFESAKTTGESSKKWLMVNVQNVREFVCQVLNRDVWSDPRVKAIVKENFIFWQIYSDSSEGERFMSFYNVAKWPHVSILDPRTGGHFATINKHSREEVIDEITSFLEQHGTLGSDNGPPAKKIKHDILDASEDSQLAAAIAASLRESEAANPVEACTNSRSSDSFDSLSEMDSDYEKSAGEEATNSNNVLKKANQNNENASPKRKLVKIFPKKTASKLNPFLLAKNRCLTQDSGAAGNERTSAGCGVSCSKVIDSCGEEPTHCGNGLPESPSTAASQKFSIMLRFPDGGRDKFVLREDNTVGDLVDIVATKGYDPQQFELVTNYPRRLISDGDPSTTLAGAGLNPQEAIFVQEKI